jgi:hypothetical protein
MAWHTNNFHMLQAARPQVAPATSRSAAYTQHAWAARLRSETGELGEFADESLSGGSRMRHRLIAGETAKSKGANLQRSGGGGFVS